MRTGQDLTMEKKIFAMIQNVKSVLISVLLITGSLILTACGDATATRQSVAEWLDKMQLELPKNLDQFNLTRLLHYENQVIATIEPDNEGTFEALTDSDAFHSVSQAICELPGLSVVWDADHELYSSIKSDDGSTLLTVRTKRFDCCVLESMASMSRQEAQNQCPYED